MTANGHCALVSRRIGCLELAGMCDISEARGSVVAIRGWIVNYNARHPERSRGTRRHQGSLSSSQLLADSQKAFPPRTHPEGAVLMAPGPSTPAQAPPLGMTRV